MKLFTRITIDFVKTKAHIFYTSGSFLILLNPMTFRRNTDEKPP